MGGAVPINQKEHLIMSELQPFTPGQTYTYNEVNYPNQQTLSPATRPDLAFRPSCDQLASVVQADGATAFLWAGEWMTQYEGQHDIADPQTQLWLDADGVCKVGGVFADIVPLDRLPKPSVAEAVAAPEGTAATAEVGANYLSVGLGVALIAAALYALYASHKRWRKAQDDKFKQPNAEPTIFTQLMDFAKEDASND